MTSPLAGRVIIAAGEGERIDAVVAALLDGDALVAVVAQRTSASHAPAWFRVDPTDPEVWQRVVPHVEQRLGPIDAAVTTADVHELVSGLLETDMRRRGHGAVIDVDAALDAADVVRSLGNTH